MGVFLALVLGQLGLFAGAWWIGRRHPRRALAVAGGLLLFQVGKVILQWRPEWEAALFPFPGYAAWHGLWLWFFSAGFFGCGAALLRLPRQRRLVAGLGLAVIAYGCLDNLWLIRPEVHGDGRIADARHHCQQSTLHTCAPASCVMLLSHLGITVSERRMAELCLTRSRGSSVFNIYRGLRLALPVESYAVEVRQVAPVDMVKPGFLAVGGWTRISHAVCVVGQGPAVLVHDPLTPAPQTWTLAQVAERLTGLSVVVTPR